MSEASAPAPSSASRDLTGVPFPGPPLHFKGLITISISLTSPFLTIFIRFFIVAVRLISVSDTFRFTVLLPFGLPRGISFTKIENTLELYQF